MSMVIEQTVGIPESRAALFEVRRPPRALKRLGFVVPPGEEGDPFYRKANLRKVLRGMKDLEAGRNCHVHELAETDD
jgi:hypothetical protein